MDFILILLEIYFMLPFVCLKFIVRIPCTSIPLPENPITKIARLFRIERNISESGNSRFQILQLFVANCRLNRRRESVLPSGFLLEIIDSPQKTFKTWRKYVSIKVPRKSSDCSILVLFYNAWKGKILI